jgi:transposase-like protein
MLNILSQIHCPRCHSPSLFKFGKDAFGNQKYRCKECRRQFAPDSPSSSRHLKGYPKCPLCGKATFAHHVHKYYVRLRCCDKKCNHVFSYVTNSAIPDPSSAFLHGKPDFSGMRFPLHVILLALNLFYSCNVSTRKISAFLLSSLAVRVSHVSVSRWIKLFAPAFSQLASDLSRSIRLSDSDEWHCDETVVKIKGKKFYIWFLLDSETRFVIDFHLSPFRDSQQALSLLANARKNFGSPSTSLVSDRFMAYTFTVKNLFPHIRHIRVESFDADISNNLIEAFHGQFKAWYKPRRGFFSFDSANSLISVFVFFYNFIRPHSGLNGLSPAQVAGLDYSEQTRNSWFLIA